MRYRSTEGWAGAKSKKTIKTKKIEENEKIKENRRKYRIKLL